MDALETHLLNMIVNTAGRKALTTQLSAWMSRLRQTNKPRLDVFCAQHQSTIVAARAQTALIVIMAALHARTSAHMLATTSKLTAPQQPRRCSCVGHGLSTSRHIVAAPRITQREAPSQRRELRRGLRCWSHSCGATATTVLT